MLHAAIVSNVTEFEVTVTHPHTAHNYDRRPPREGFVPFPFRSAKRHQRTSATQHTHSKKNSPSTLHLEMNSHHNDFHFDFDEEQSSAPPAKQQQQHIIHGGDTMPRSGQNKKRRISRPNRNDVLCGRGEHRVRMYVCLSLSLRVSLFIVATPRS